MKALNFNDVLGADDLPIVDVEVPQWGGFVGVRTLRADERAEIEKHFAKKKPSDDPGGFRRLLLKSTLVNPDKTPFIPEGDEYATQFMKKNAEAIETLFEKACELNGFRQKDVEQIEKN